MLAQKCKSNSVLLKPFLRLVRKKDKILICGPLGYSLFVVPTNLHLQQRGLHLQLVGSSKDCEKWLPTYTCLLKQHLRGVELGFFEILVIQGIGWRVSVQGQTLHFLLGYSQKITYNLKLGIECITYDKQCFKIFGLDRGLVYQTVADLCHLRQYNVYKGKGIVKKTDSIKLKVSSKSKA